MKKFIFSLFFLNLFFCQFDIAGSYRMTDYQHRYTYVSRASVDMLTNDVYGLGIVVPAISILPGQLVITSQISLDENELNHMGLFMRFNLYDDGVGEIPEGSAWIGIDCDSEYCSASVVSVSDQFIYTSDLTAGLIRPVINPLGMPSLPTSLSSSTLMGEMGVLSSSVLPLIPSSPSIENAPGDIFIGDVDGSGTLEVYPDLNLMGIPEYLPEGAPLLAPTAGYVLKETTNPLSEGSTDLYLEVYSNDGYFSNTGFGFNVDEDEDGDGSAFDRNIIVGLPTCSIQCPGDHFVGISLPISYDALGPCLNYENFYSMNSPMYNECEFVDSYADEFIIPTLFLNSSIIPHGYENLFLSFNLLMYLETQQYEYLEDISDQGYYFDPSNCQFDTLDDCSGLLLFEQVPNNIPVFEFREQMLAFDSEEFFVLGDATLDGEVNVQDVVSIVHYIGGGHDYSSEMLAAADYTQDGIVNVLDIVAIIEFIMTGSDSNSFSDDTNNLRLLNELESQINELVNRNNLLEINVDLEKITIPNTFMK